ncbi:hypothetical protein [Rubritalea halochordaticola]
MRKYFSSSLMAGLLLSGAMACSVVAEEHTQMEKDMKETGSALKSLRKIEKSDYEGGAKLVREAHEALLKSMSQQASMVKDMPDGVDKQKALADSRRLLGLAYAALCELEIAYLEKDDAKIEAAMTKIKDSKKEGHKKYTDD